jgi:non-ribosomal peptide synthase protein (TIGR01720 family)
VSALARAAGAAAAGTADQGPVTGPVTLTPPQRAFLDADPPHPEHAVQAMMLELRGPVDAEALRGAVARIVEHHDALRLRFVRDADGWRAENAPADGPVPFDSVHLDALSPAEQDRAMEARTRQAQASLALDAGCLLAAVHFHLGPDRPARLLLAVHALAADGMSWRMLVEDLEACSMDGGARLPAKSTSYRDWAARLAEHAGSGALDGEAAWWADALRPGAALLPADDPAGGDTRADERKLSVTLDADETHALLHRVPESFSIQPHEVLIAALARALGERAGGGEVLLELRTHGREELFADVDLSRTVGPFACGFPVRLALPEGGAGAVLRAVKEQVRAVPGRGIGYAILRHLHPGAAGETLRERPRAPVAFQWLGAQDAAWPDDARITPAPDAAVGAMHPAGAARPYAIEVSTIVTRGRLRADWTFGGTHRTATVQAMADRWLRELRAMMAHALESRDAGLTPSDFPEAALSQDELDGVLAELEGLA